LAPILKAAGEPVTIVREVFRSPLTAG